LFVILFFVGIVGFIAMTILGFVHVGGGHHAVDGGTHAIGHGGHGVGHGIAHGSGHALGTDSGMHSVAHSSSAPTAGHQANGGHAVVTKASGEISSALESNNQMTAPWWAAVSPLDLFSLSMGAGATGILLQPYLHPTALGLASAGGALLVTFGIIRPLIGALTRFASRPSEGLEGMIAKEATAATKFDSTGKGLIAVTLDGQIIQVLATLERAEHSNGIQVKKGDCVTITEVDTSRNTCRVTRELSA
jgi:hypothetical protein